MCLSEDSLEKKKKKKVYWKKSKWIHQIALYRYRKVKEAFFIFGVQWSNRANVLFKK